MFDKKWKETDAKWLAMIADMIAATILAAIVAGIAAAITQLIDMEMSLFVLHWIRVLDTFLKNLAIFKLASNFVPRSRGPKQMDLCFRF